MLKLKENTDLRRLEEISPHIKPRISKRAKRIALRLDPKTNDIHLVIPPRASMKKALDFAFTHQDWIREKIETRPAPIPFEDGVSLPLFGEDIMLDIYYDITLKRTSITLNKNILSIKTNKEEPSLRITRFLKEKARERLASLAHEKAGQIDKTVKRVQVRDTKSRWGSCSPDGTISFSWRIIFAPIAALDYLVAHEVAHLTHKNHGPQFWALCEELSTDYKAGKEWIRKHGHSLMRYGISDPVAPT